MKNAYIILDHRFSYVMEHNENRRDLQLIPCSWVKHEGRKGWKCCKARVLTFDEFMDIPPCTTGKHSTVDDTPDPQFSSKEAVPDVLAPVPQAPSKAEAAALHAPAIRPLSGPEASASNGSLTPAKSTTPVPIESDSDDLSLPLPPTDTICKRRGCGISSKTLSANDNRSKEACVYHSGQPVFHEGSKGWSCCKRRVLEFDEFMKIPGCKTRTGHLFAGKRSGSKRTTNRKEANAAAINNSASQSTSAQDDDDYESLTSVRHDYYQTATSIHASIFLKKIVAPPASTIEFDSLGKSIHLNLRTSDAKKYVTTIPLYGLIDPSCSKFKVLGTKLELELAKAGETVGQGWPVLRSDERLTGEIIQTGGAGRV